MDVINDNKVKRPTKREQEFIDLYMRRVKPPQIASILGISIKTVRVYISILGSKSKKNTMDGIKNASGFIRTELAKRVNLRYTPELVFELDETLEYGAKIDSILEELKKKEGK